MLTTDLYLPLQIVGEKMVFSKKKNRTRIIGYKDKKKKS